MVALHAVVMDPCVMQHQVVGQKWIPVFRVGLGGHSRPSPLLAGMARPDMLALAWSFKHVYSANALQET